MIARGFQFPSVFGNSGNFGNLFCSPLPASLSHDPNGLIALHAGALVHWMREETSKTEVLATTNQKAGSSNLSGRLIKM